MTGADVKRMPEALLEALAAEIREKILQTVSTNGGHLASSLGTVELTIALLRVFDPLVDRIVWDVGHQTYAWKLLTGRTAAFPTLRTFGGVGGFPNPDESPADAFVAGHAGVALAAAEGLAAARDLRGGHEECVAITGDASLTNGENLEAINNCASLTKKVIFILNDNEMSISQNVGATARFLGKLISDVRYNRVKKAAEKAGHHLKLTFLRGLYHRIESRIKSLWLANGFFERYGLRYIGPVDGHDIAAMTAALTVAKEEDRSVIVHVVTVKGKGFPPAEHNPARWHGTGPFPYPAASAMQDTSSSGASWSDVFGETLAKLAARDARVCALTAAMRDGTGLHRFAERFPKRFFDTGICEEQLVTFAAGLAQGGMKSVVAIYSTFLQRAVDQVMHDICLQRLPVVLAIDRAGVVGSDGRTHHGLYDIAWLRCLPGLTILQPKDACDLRAMLSVALSAKGPVAIRYPRGTAPEHVDVPEDSAAEVQIWALGDQVAKAVRVSQLLMAAGISCGVNVARQIKPVEKERIGVHVSAGKRIVTLENGALAGGWGSAVQEAFPGVVIMRFGWPDRIVGHGTLAELEREARFDAESIACDVMDVIKGDKR